MLKQVQHDILFCHPEFISGSIFFENKREMLKQVQHDNIGIPKQELA